MKKVISIIIVSLLLMVSLTACNENTVPKKEVSLAKFSLENMVFANTEWGMTKDQVCKQLKLSDKDLKSETTTDSESADSDVFTVKGYKYNGEKCDLSLAFSNANDVFAVKKGLCSAHIAFSNETSFKKIDEELEKSLGKPQSLNKDMGQLIVHRWESTKSIYSYLNSDDKKFEKFIDYLLESSIGNSEEYKKSISWTFKNAKLANITVINSPLLYEEKQLYGVVKFEGFTQSYLNYYLNSGK